MEMETCPARSSARAQSAEFSIESEQRWRESIWTPWNYCSVFEIQTRCHIPVPHANEETLVDDGWAWIGNEQETSLDPWKGETCSPVLVLSWSQGLEDAIKEGDKDVYSRLSASTSSEAVRRLNYTSCNMMIDRIQPTPFWSSIFSGSIPPSLGNKESIMPQPVALRSWTHSSVFSNVELYGSTAHQDWAIADFLGITVCPRSLHGYLLGADFVSSCLSKLS